MGEHSDVLGSRTLLDITLPGSHNSGNYAGGLSGSPLCESDYRYHEYLTDPSTAEVQAHGGAPLSQLEFDKRMIPWNVNHFLPIAEQLVQDGARYFHLKICNFGQPNSARMNLSRVRFQHRGYTTHETVASMIDGIKDFLSRHPGEIVVLGFNNLHNAESTHFGDADIVALATALVEKIGTSMLVSKSELYTRTVDELTASGKRIVIFMQGRAAVAGRLPVGIIPSIEALTEDWDDVMASGDLEGSKAWLFENLQRHAMRHDRYYVMQANPNNHESEMYKAINSGRGSQSNEAFLTPFIRTLPALVSRAVNEVPRLHINVVDTDFLNISSALEIAKSLMRIKTTV